MTKKKELREASNGRTIRALYEAFDGRDVETIQRLLASDIEWWYHGPPAHQYMMQFLTGTSSNSCTASRTSSASSSSSSDEDIEDSFSFVPSSITPCGSLVIVEGCDLSRLVSWVHVWTVSDDDNGIVTQLREYFNTSLTITRFENNWNSKTNQSSSSSKPSRNFPLANSAVWESKLSSTVGKSVPGLLLAI
ncbi:hypothetical protein MKX01_004425 [Papaver californicum]|nr:hypothetical protein MKX01_004425 [Papaver californicum]